MLNIAIKWVIINPSAMHILIRCS